MLTVLMALFIVLFALGQVDKTKFAALAAGMSNGLGGPVGILTSSSNGVMEMDGTVDAHHGRADRDQAADGRLDRAGAPGCGRTRRS